MRHEIKVNDRKIEITQEPRLIANNVATDTLGIILDEAWADMDEISVIFKHEKSASRRLAFDGEDVTIPWEVMTDVGALRVTVVGYVANPQQRLVTKFMQRGFLVEKNGEFFGDEAIDPSPDEIAEIYSTIDDLKKFIEDSIGDDTVEEAVKDLTSYIDFEVGNLSAQLNTLKNDLSPTGAIYLMIDNAATTAAAAEKSIQHYGTIVDSHGVRITGLEEKVGDGFADVTSDEILALFQH